MPDKGHIPAGLVKAEIVAIDARLKRLEQEARRAREEIAQLQVKRSVLTDLQGKAAAKAPKNTRKRRGIRRCEDDGPIPDGRVATPIIFGMIRQHPGITSVQIMDAIEHRVTKNRRETPRKFLADLIWELGHRKRIRRETDGGLYLVEEGSAP